jgi:hypothetical protein
MERPLGNAFPTWLVATAWSWLGCLWAAEPLAFGGRELSSGAVANGESAEAWSISRVVRQSTALVACLPICLGWFGRWIICQARPSIQPWHERLAVERSSAGATRTGAGLFVRWWVCIGLSGLLYGVVGASELFAWAPRVQFDMPTVLSCRNVTPPDFAAAFPGEQLIMVEFEISSFVQGGSVNDLLELEYRFATRGMSLLDYAPRTTLESDYSAPLQFEEKRERTTTAGVAVVGGWEFIAKATGNGDFAEKNTQLQKYELVPPSEAVTASGSILGGQGVFIKMRPSRSQTLEGAKPFRLVWRVSRSWRSELLEVTCLSWGRERSIVRSLDDRVRCGEASFRAVMYFPGDEGARILGEELIWSDRQLRRSAVKHQDAIRRTQYPSIFHELGSQFEVVSPRLPDRWLEQLVRTPPDRFQDSVYERLPDPVRSAAIDYVTAYWRYQQLQLAR